jgi:hypothetical protein
LNGSFFPGRGQNIFDAASDAARDIFSPVFSTRSKEPTKYVPLTAPRSICGC